MRKITTDLVVVGSSIGGLTAAIVAREAGLEVLVVEASAQVGGAASTSPGMLWLPNNAWQGNEDDSEAQARAYLATVLGKETPASTKERRDNFIRKSAEVSRWLKSLGVILQAEREYPDFFPQDQVSKRILKATAFNRSELGALAAYLGPNPTTFDTEEIAIRGLRSAWLTSKEILQQKLANKRNRALGGAALVGSLLQIAAKKSVQIWTQSPAIEAISQGKSLAGVVVQRNHENISILASRGVVLACGGFAKNLELRKKHLPAPTADIWSLAHSQSQGFALQAAELTNAQLAAMDQAWWTPIMLVKAHAYALAKTLSLPHSMVVDANGYRFMNEAAPPAMLGQQMYQRNAIHHAIPAFLIMDNRHRAKYRLGPWLPGATPDLALLNDEIYRANSIKDLAQALDIDVAGLIGSVVRFNTGAMKAKDPDFHRGETPYEQFLGDSSYKNPNIGKITKPPFWGVKIFPGDTGTKGGLLCNAKGEVLDKNGAVIPRLYVCGGAAASMVKNAGPALGIQLTTALVEGYSVGCNFKAEV